MFGIGFFELLIIAVFALIFVGPKKLPDLMRQAGKFFVQIRRTTNDVRSTFDQVIRDAEDELRREDAAQLKALLTGDTTGTKATDATSTADTHPAPHGGHDPHHGHHHGDGHHHDPHHDPHHDQHHGDGHHHPTTPGDSRAYTPGSSQSPGLTQDATWHPVPPAAAGNAAPAAQPAASEPAAQPTPTPATKS